jgi:hypothetical protein
VLLQALGLLKAAAVLKEASVAAAGLHSCFVLGMQL